MILFVYRLTLKPIGGRRSQDGPNFARPRPRQTYRPYSHRRCHPVPLSRRVRVPFRELVRGGGRRSFPFCRGWLFGTSMILRASGRLGLFGCIVRRIFWLAPPWVASPNVLKSGFARSLISAPRGFKRTLCYFALNSDSVKGPDTRPPPESFRMTFCKASSLHKTVL